MIEGPQASLRPFQIFRPPIKHAEHTTDALHNHIPAILDTTAPASVVE